MRSKFQAVHQFNKREAMRAKIGKYFLLLLLILFAVSEIKAIYREMTTSRVVIINNVQAKEIEVKEVEIEQPKVESVKNQSVDEIVDKIYRLESSAGINDSCKAQGKFNGYGYGIYQGSYRCFESHEEVTKIVTAWMNEKLKSHSLAKALCGYNLGFNSDHLQECMNQSQEYPYYKNFLSL